MSGWRSGGCRALGLAVALGKLVVAVASMISSVRGAEYFVSPSGDNGNSGSSSAPWRTLQYAADSVHAGDRVVVRAGTYTQGFYLSTTGTQALPIQFVAEPNVLITGRNPTTNDGINLEGASWVTIDGFAVSGTTLRAGVRTVLADHVTIRNVHAYDNGRWGIFTGFVDDLLIENNETSGSIAEHGIYVSNSGDRPVLRGNKSWGNHGAGIHMNGDFEQQPGDGIISGALITGNLIYGNAASINGGPLGGGSGINMDGVQNSRIENNLLYGNHASGISLYRIDGAEGSRGNVVVNNTVVQPGNPADDDDGRWALNIQDDSIGNTVRNNILVTAHEFRGALDISAESLAGFSSDYNVVTSRFTSDGGDTVQTLAQWQASTPHDDHSLVATPAELFVNAAGGDFHLKAGSPAVNSGSSLQAPAVDFFGVARPQGTAVDIGAAEAPAGLAADFNGDNQVNGVDLAVWRGGFGTAAGATKGQGDADGDHDVDGGDLLTWQRQFGRSVNAASVPEPTTFALLIVAARRLKRR
jgi:parallel beta-helix repeat protein